MSWFPLPKSLMECEQFRALSPIGKVYLWLLMSEFNRRGGTFYKADLEIAVTLNVRRKSIRRARKVLSELGWIKVKRGFQNSRGQGIATRYLDVAWSTTGALDEGDFWAPIDYHTFHMMLNRLRQGTLQPADLVVYVFLTYWRWKCKGRWRDEDQFFITKGDLRKLTKLPNSPKRLKKLYENFVFCCGTHLFEFDGYNKLTITNWNIAADPDQEENNRRNAERWIEEIKKGVQRGKETIKQTTSARGNQGALSFDVKAQSPCDSIGVKREATKETARPKKRREQKRADKKVDPRFELLLKFMFEEYERVRRMKLDPIYHDPDRKAIENMLKKMPGEDLKKFQKAWTRFLKTEDKFDQKLLDRTPVKYWAQKINAFMSKGELDWDALMASVRKKQMGES